MTKTISRTVDGATISATAAEALAPMVDSALDLFEEVRADWADGFVLWMGWCPLALRETDAGYLVMSPDLALDPRKDITADLSLALGTAVHLGAIPQRAGLEPQEIDFNNDVICTLTGSRPPGCSSHAPTRRRHRTRAGSSSRSRHRREPRTGDRTSWSACRSGTSGNGGRMRPT